jgi:YD repeat-containing protein
MIKLTNKKITTLKKTLFVVMLVFYSLVSAQENVNIDLFRGKNNITIPIYNFNSRHLSLPISLVYSPVDIVSERWGSNIAVPTTPLSEREYHPGWTGLGWNLTAGGVISRTINGEPDESEGNTTNHIPPGNLFNSDSEFNPIKNQTDISRYEAGEDEFSFNFCGYTGTFMYYRGEWKIFSDVNLSVVHIIDSGSITGFTVTAPDGITYTFGGSTATEYTTFSSGSPRVSTSWFLTQIKSPEGDQINLTYETGNGHYRYITKQCTVESKAENDSHFSIVNVSPTNDQIANFEIFNIIEPVYLTNISSTSSPISMKFSKSDATELKYPGETDNSHWYKLDKIELLNNLVSFKKFDLTYNEQSTQPLELKSVQESSISTDGLSTQLPPYQFGYIAHNDMTAPSVLNKITYPTGGFSSFEFEQNNYDVYPGSFVGQLAYGYFSNLSPIPSDVFNYSDGFRLKKQVNKSSDTDKGVVLNYYYTDNYPELNPELAYDNISTGIKNRGIITERTDGTLWKVGSDLITYKIHTKTGYDCVCPGEGPNITIKQHSLVGYSSVWVVQSKEGESPATSVLESTNYKFTNYATVIWDVNEYPHCTFNDLNQVGKMISCAKYNAQGNEIIKTQYTYTKGLETKLVRYYLMSASFLSLGQKQTSSWFYAYRDRYARYNLTKEVTIKNNQYIVTTYKYDNNTNNLTEKTVTEPYLVKPNASSIDNPVYTTTTTSYRYTNEFVGGLSGGNQPVEKIVLRNGMVIAAEYTKFTTLLLNQSSVFVLKPSEVYALEISSPLDPASFKLQQPNWDWTLPDGSQYKLKTTFDSYDDYGNLREYHNAGDAHVTIDYDGPYQYPFIELRNCTYSNYQAKAATAGSDLGKLRKSLPSAQITSYTYDPKFGITSVTTPNGITTYTVYDDFGRVKYIKDNNGKILKTIEYNFNIQ